MSDNKFQVAIVGAGPTGLVLANLLGVYGIRTLVIERNPSTVDEPRAVSIDDESLRSLQAAGVVDEVLREVVQGYGVHYYSWSGRMFAKVEPTSLEYGFPKRNAFRQQRLVAQLRESLIRFPHVETRFECELLRHEQTDGRVTLHLSTHDIPSAVDCEWLIACDGGRSGVREQLAIQLNGSTYVEKWLIVDMIGRLNPFRHTRTYCDPNRPAIRLPGPNGTVRYEFMLLEGETPEQVLDEAQIREWMAHREPTDRDLTIVRKVVYTFHARVADKWRQGRVLLAGDAAHLTPPFAGQGMNSGVRDATNLAWKLAAVIRGELPDSLMETYEQERRPHAWALIQMALRIGHFMQPKTVLSAMIFQGLLRLSSLYPPARDYVLQLRFKPKPRFFDGYFTPRESAKGAPTAGQLMPQPQVEFADGKKRLLDDVLGDGFALIQRSGFVANAADLRVIESFPSVRKIRLIAKENDFLANDLSDESDGHTVRDIEGVIANVLTGSGANAVLIRPDRYIHSFF